MPYKPKRLCAHAGCRNTSDSKYCEEHKKARAQQADERRGTAAERGYDSRWKKARLTYLRHNPLCVECLKSGSTVPATVVDHIVPHKGDQALFWDTDNWQSLCKYHHDKKTAAHDGAFGKRRGG